MASDDTITLSAAEEKELVAACKTQWLDDVPGTFADLKPEGTKLQVHSDGTFPDKYVYTKSSRNNAGNENHFQGCARLLTGHHVALSGGDWYSKSSHLFLARLQSKAGRKKWDTNLGGDGPPTSDKVVARVDLHPQMWHAGGIALCGFVVAVPIECGPGRAYGVRGVKPPKCEKAKSRICLVDVRTPAAPKLLTARIDRAGRKATAVALTHVPGTGYVAAVLAAEKAEEADPRFSGKRVDFYRSVDGGISGGFTKPPTKLRIPVGLKWDDYQTINFVRETSGTLYLFGMTGQIADLFKVTLPEPGPPPVPPKLEFMARREFVLDKDFAEFKAGVGTYTKDGMLGMYAVPQWRRVDGRLGLTEWA